MTLASLIFLVATLAVFLSSAIAPFAVDMLRRFGLLPLAIVNVDGLLEELFALWPLEEDERYNGEGLGEECAKVDPLLRRA